MYRSAVAAFAVSVIAGVQAAGAATINVPANQPTIQAAINVANTLDEVVVAPGTYVEQIDFMGKAITVRSSGGPNVTTIDGNGGGSTVTFDDDEDVDSILDGFTITGGTGTSNGIGGFNGGGIYCFLADPTIRNCIVTGNTALGPGADGGGMNCTFSFPDVVNCVFYDNTATVAGGGVYNQMNSAPTFTNCAFVDNTAAQGGGIFTASSTARLISCISWFNNDDAVAGSAIITYSNIENGFSGEGNINLNPQFVDLAGGNLELSDTSPCIDAGDSTSLVNKGVTSDLNGDPRAIDVTAVADSGKHVLGLVVDMGPYEVQMPCKGGPGSCDGDITDSKGGDPDGIVNLFDLLELLDNWGACP